MWCQVLSSIDHIVIGLLSPLPETCLRLAYVTAMCRDMLVCRICYGCGVHMLRFWGVPFMRQSILTTMWTFIECCIPNIIYLFNHPFDLSGHYLKSSPWETSSPVAIDPIWLWKHKKIGCICCPQCCYIIIIIYLCNHPKDFIIMKDFLWRYIYGLNCDQISYL